MKEQDYPYSMFIYYILQTDNTSLNVFCILYKKSRNLTDAFRNHNTNIGKSFYAYFVCTVGIAVWLFSQFS